MKTEEFNKWMEHERLRKQRTRRTWFIVIGALVVLGIIGAIGSHLEEKQTDQKPSRHATSTPAKRAVETNRARQANRGAEGRKQHAAQPTKPSTPEVKAQPPITKETPSRPSNEVRITEAEYGSSWPFTVGEGVLACKGSRARPEVVLTARGVTYALNGVAMSSGKYSRIDAIWADDPTMAGMKRNIGPIIDRGLQLCR